jgi:hypothetical protein
MITAAGRIKAPHTGRAPNETSFTAIMLETIKQVTKIEATRGRKR